MNPMIIALPIAGALALGVGIGTALPRPTPEACITSLEKADDLLRSAGKTMDLTVQFLQRYPLVTALDPEIGQITGMQPTIQAQVDAYNSAKKGCQ